MATAEVKTKVILELEIEEAMILMGLLRNSYYIDLTDEPDTERKAREAVFSALSFVLVGHTK